jgi:hypothetical protein
MDRLTQSYTAPLCNPLHPPLPALQTNLLCTLILPLRSQFRDLGHHQGLSKLRA